MAVPAARGSGSREPGAIAELRVAGVPLRRPPSAIPRRMRGDELRRVPMRPVGRERKRQRLAAVHSLWRVGDGVRRLRSVVRRGGWSEALVACGARAGVHPSSLDEAARAARAFGTSERRRLCVRVEGGATDLTPSHVLALARVPRETRALAIEAM